MYLRNSDSNNKMMERFLLANKEQREHLRKVFGCTDRMIREALSFRSESDLARRIRIAAKKHGCRVHVVVDEMECLFDCNGTIHQLFPNGAQLEINKSSGEGILLYKGKTIAEYHSVRVSDMRDIQKRAIALS